MSGQHGIVIEQVVEFFVFPTQYAIFNFVVEIGIPVSAVIRYHSVNIPRWQIDKRTVFNLRTNGASVNNVFEHEPGYAATDLPVEMVQVSVEVKENLCTYNVGNTSGVVLRMRHQPDIALFQFRIGIVNDELRLFIEGGFEFFFYFRNVFACIIGYMLG